MAAPNKEYKLTHARLLQLLNYDPTTGVFTWRERRSSHSPKGGVAGRTKQTGYREIGIDGVLYYAHRLAWFYAFGEWPSCEIDHRDLNRSNNALNNLRAATRFQQVHNLPKTARNTTGLKGAQRISRPTKTKSYWSRIRVFGKTIMLGRFATAEEAHAAYVAAANHYFGEYARHE